MDPNTFNKWLAATLTEIKPCYHRDMTQAVYGEAPGVRSTTLKYRRPKEMRFSIENPLKETYALTLGAATHIAILEPDKFDTVDGVSEFFQYCETDGLNTKKAEAQRLAYPDKPLVNEGMIEKARRLRDAVFANIECDRLLRVKRDTELSGFAWNADSQIIEKIRVDFYPHEANYLLDVKNMQSIEIAEIWKTVKARGYALSAAMQLDVDARITGKRRPLFYLICLEGPTGASDDPKSAPYEAQLVEIATGDGDPSLVKEARPVYQERLNRFANAARTNTWEGNEHEPCVYLKAKPPWKE